MKMTAMRKLSDRLASLVLILFATNDGDEIAWAICKNSPLVKKELDEFVARHRIGAVFGNDLRLRYVTSAKTIENAIADAEAKKPRFPANSLNPTPAFRIPNQ